MRGRDGSAPTGAAGCAPYGGVDAVCGMECPTSLTSWGSRRPVWPLGTESETPCDSAIGTLEPVPACRVDGDEDPLTDIVACQREERGRGSAVLTRYRALLGLGLTSSLLLLGGTAMAHTQK